MALTKTQLKEILSAAGVAAENATAAVERIMDGHLASVNALREERDGYKADADKLKEVQKELDDLKAKGDGDWQNKYETEKTAFANYKKQIEADKIKDQKVKLYKAVLKDCGVAEKRIETILKVTDIDKLKVKDDALDGLDDIKKGIKKEWADFITSDKEKGAHVDNPPENNGGNNGRSQSRAAQIAAEYHRNLYGEIKKGE